MPDTWQDSPGKFPGRLETSKDSEAEESKQLTPPSNYLLTNNTLSGVAFSSSYLTMNSSGVTISGMNFRTINFIRGISLNFIPTEEHRLKFVSVARGAMEVK